MLTSTQLTARQMVWMRRAHERFLTRGEVAPRVSSAVAASWERSARIGIDPDAPTPPVDLSDQDVAALRRDHPLAWAIPIARTLLLEPDAGWVAALTDTAGPAAVGGGRRRSPPRTGDRRLHGGCRLAGGLHRHERPRHRAGHRRRRASAGRGALGHPDPRLELRRRARARHQRSGARRAGHHRIGPRRLAARRLAAARDRRHDRGAHARCQPGHAVGRRERLGRTRPGRRCRSGRRGRGPQRPAAGARAPPHPADARRRTHPLPGTRRSCYCWPSTRRG